MQNSFKAAEIRHTTFDMSCNMLVNKDSKDAVVPPWDLASVAFSPLLLQCLLPIAGNFSTFITCCPLPLASSSDKWKIKI